MPTRLTAQQLVLCKHHMWTSSCSGWQWLAPRAFAAPASIAAAALEQYSGVYTCRCAVHRCITHGNTHVGNASASCVCSCHCRSMQHCTTQSTHLWSPFSCAQNTCHAGQQLRRGGAAATQKAMDVRVLPYIIDVGCDLQRCCSLGQSQACSGALFCLQRVR